MNLSVDSDTSSRKQAVPLNPAYLMAPIRYSMWYLLGTYLLFVGGNLWQDVANKAALTVFVIGSYVAFYVGYRLGATLYRPSRWVGRTADHADDSKWIIAAGSLYLIAWGVNQLVEFGGSSLRDILRAVLSPGAAYKTKFEVFEAWQDLDYVSRVTQILVISHFFYAASVPMGILYWSKLSSHLRTFFVLSVFVYTISFMAIGTIKGLGDIFLLMLAGGAVLIGRNAASGRKPMGRKVKGLLLVAFLAIFIYMATSQLSRAEEFGIAQTLSVGDVSQSWISDLFGRDVAYAFYSVLGYPSHGYFGLAYCLELPFEFSHGAGLSQALESYRFQYLGGTDYYLSTYPVRNELVTGWPAKMYWSTIFPWLASDISFFGVPFLMAGLGFLFFRLWISSVTTGSVISIAALGQFFIFIAFIPANNQVLMQRQGVWAVFTLIVLWLVQNLRRRAQRA